MTNLPLPHLEKQESGFISVITDNALAEAIGVRVAFSGRHGGVSQEPFDELNLGDHVGDDMAAVAENRRMLLRVFGDDSIPLVVPRQVHGTDFVSIESSESFCVEDARARAGSGADGLLVFAPRVAALLCFADCVPVVIVSPTGAFAVVHAGWRGIYAGIASKAVSELAQHDVDDFAFVDSMAAAASFNVYIGPHIAGECFETGADVHEMFCERFGERCAVDAKHIDLAKALEIDLVRAGVDAARIALSGVCTKCECDDYYSYRASGGVCGRHGALAFRKEF